MLDTLNYDTEEADATMMRDLGFIPVWPVDLVNDLRIALPVGPYDNKKWVFGVVKDLVITQNTPTNQYGEPILGETPNRLVRFFMLADDGTHYEKTVGDHYAIWAHIPV